MRNRLFAAGMICMAGVGAFAIWGPRPGEPFTDGYDGSFTPKGLRGDWIGELRDGQGAEVTLALHVSESGEVDAAYPEVGCRASWDWAVTLDSYPPYYGFDATPLAGRTEDCGGMDPTVQPNGSLRMHGEQNPEGRMSFESGYGARAWTGTLRPAEPGEVAAAFYQGGFEMPR